MPSNVMNEVGHASKMFTGECDCSFEFFLEDASKRKYGSDALLFKKLLDEHPLVFSHAVTTGTIAEAAIAAGISVDKGKENFLRRVLREYKSAARIENDEKLNIEVRGNVFQTLNCDDIENVPFKMKRLASTTTRVHDEELLNKLLENEFFAAAYARYLAMSDTRKQILRTLEQQGYFENRLSSLYGLLYRCNKNETSMKIPDFISFNTKNVSFIYLIDRETTSEEKISRMYANYVAYGKEYYIWTGCELERFLRDLKNEPGEINWAVFDGAYRGKGNFVWDVLNDSDFQAYYSTHTPAESARKYGLATRQLAYIARKFPEVARTIPVKQYSDVVVTADLARDIQSSEDAEHIVFLSENDEPYQQAKKWLSYNDANWDKYASQIKAFGYQRNICENGDIIAVRLPDGDLFVPDLVMFLTERYKNMFVGMMLGNLERDTEPSYIDKLKDANRQYEKIAFKCLWEQEIDEYYERFLNGVQKQALGRLAYHGVGTVHAVPNEDLALFLLSHSEEEAREHYGLSGSSHEVYIYAGYRGLKRNDILARKAFPCPYQTIPREQLSDKQDTVWHLGKYRGERPRQQLWRTATDAEVEALYSCQGGLTAYQENFEIRQRFLPYMERLNFIENRLDGPYGLLYRRLDSGEVLIPDFVDMDPRSSSDVIFFNDLDENGQIDEERLKTFEDFRSRCVESFNKLFLFDLANSEIQRSFELSSKDNMTRRIWSNKIVASRCYYVLKHLHNVELRKYAEIEAAKQSFERFQRASRLRTLGEAYIKEALDQDIQIVEFEARIASTHARTITKDNCFKYLRDNEAEKDLRTLSHKKSLARYITIDDIDEQALEAYQRYADNAELRKDMLPYVEQLKLAVNCFENGLGLLGFSSKSAEDVVIPDFIGVEARETGRTWITMLFILDRDADSDNALFYKLCEVNKASVNIRCQIRVLWSGYHSKCVKRDIVGGTFQWAFYKNRYLGKNDAVWNMLNNPIFPGYYNSHSARDTAKYFGINKSQLEHAIYMHQEFRRPDDLQRIRSSAASGFERSDLEFAEMDGRKVSRAELSLIPFLDELGLKHNDSQSIINGPVIFGGLGVCSMIPDFISPDRKVVVEFDGEYFHLDPREAEFRKMYYDYMGIQCAIIWEGELSDFVTNPPESIDELLDRYPCSWRNIRAEVYYVLKHDYDFYLEKLCEKIECSCDVDAQ